MTWRNGGELYSEILDTRTLEIQKAPFPRIFRNGPLPGILECWHRKQDLLLYRIDSALLVVQGRPEFRFPVRFGPVNYCGTQLAGVALPFFRGQDR